VGLGRVLRHLCYDYWNVRSAFPPHAMGSIERTIGEQERRHDGELRFAVEASLPLVDLIRGVTGPDRAIELFGRLRVWDTEQNAGVLIYLLLADKRVEIVADRGIHRRVGATAWEAICGNMQREFAAGRFEAGALAGLQAVSDLLATHFPPRDENPDELANQPVIVD
jgi:TPM domain